MGRLWAAYSTVGTHHLMSHCTRYQKATGAQGSVKNQSKEKQRRWREIDGGGGRKSSTLTYSSLDQSVMKVTAELTIHGLTTAWISVILDISEGMGGHSSMAMDMTAKGSTSGRGCSRTKLQDSQRWANTFVLMAQSFHKSRLQQRLL